MRKGPGAEDFASGEITKTAESTTVEGGIESAGEEVKQPEFEADSVSESRQALESVKTSLTAMHNMNEAMSQTSPHMVDRQKSFDDFVSLNSTNLEKLNSGSGIPTSAESEIVAGGMAAEALNSDVLPEFIDKNKLYSEALTQYQRTGEESLLSGIDHSERIATLATDNSIDKGVLAEAMTKLPEGSLNEESLKTLIESGHQELLFSNYNKLNEDAAADFFENGLNFEQQAKVLEVAGQKEALGKLALAEVQNAMADKDRDRINAALAYCSAGSLEFELLEILFGSGNQELVIENLNKFKIENSEQLETLEALAEETGIGEQLKKTEDFRNLKQRISHVVLVVTPGTKPDINGKEKLRIASARALTASVINVVKKVGQVLLAAAKATGRGVASLGKALASLTK